MRERARPDVPALFEKCGRDVGFGEGDVLRLRAEDQLREVRRDFEVTLLEAFELVDDVAVFVGVFDVGVGGAAFVPFDGCFGEEGRLTRWPSPQLR